MQTTEILIFGTDRCGVNDVASEICSVCTKKGIEYKGPHQQSIVDLSEERADLNEEGVKLFGETPTDHEVAHLRHEKIFSKLFHFHRYASDDIVKDIVMRDYPEGIFLRVNVRETEFIGTDSGFAPFTYDPTVDYKTD